MTEHNLYPLNDSFNPDSFRYARQTHSERKNGGGLGRCERSYWKHDCIERYLLRQVPILSKRGLGCIIDMHSGDGLDTPHPQPDFFAGGSVKTTPALAVSCARRYPSKVILCEKNKNFLSILIQQWGNEATILGNNKDLLTMAPILSNFPWIIVINDPNGYRHQEVEVMQFLSVTVPVSDFIVVVNHRALRGCLGLKNPNHPLNSVRRSRESGVAHAWMANPNEWKVKLNKRHVLFTAPCYLSGGMTAQVLLVSNFIPGCGQ